MASQPQPASQLSDRYSVFKPSIFTHMTELANKTHAVNLGQGAPDGVPETFITEAGSRAILAPTGHQYPRSGGAPSLVNALAELYSKPLKRTLNGMENVHIGVGATDIGFSAFSGLVNPGEEVIIFEPFFDCYNAWAKIAEGHIKYIPLKHFSELENPATRGERFATDGILRSDDYTFDTQGFTDAITDKTRLILINTPHNPMGKVFNWDELSFIASIVRQFPRIIVLSDEVYDFIMHQDTGIEYTVRGLPIPEQKQQQQQLTFPELPRFATLPDMWERTLTVGSAGKMFSITGWKVGWAIGPASLVKCLSVVHCWNIFSFASPLQQALGDIINQAQNNGYYELLQERFTKRRDTLYQGLYTAGLNPILSSGGYYLVCEARGLLKPLKIDIETISHQDLGKIIAEQITYQIGVAGIPVGEFFIPEHKQHGSTLIRFAYCKSLELLQSGCERLVEFHQQQEKQQHQQQEEEQ